MCGDAQLIASVLCMGGKVDPVAECKIFIARIGAAVDKFAVEPERIVAVTGNPDVVGFAEHRKEIGVGVLPDGVLVPDTLCVLKKLHGIPPFLGVLYHVCRRNARRRRKQRRGRYHSLNSFAIAAMQFLTSNKSTKRT